MPPNARNAAQRGLEDYVDVAHRISAFFEKYPQGCLRAGTPWEVREIGDQTFVVFTALAYRTPDDEMPAEGTAWEPFPGPTQFTRNSELMNAETAAWGRALAALGFETRKGIATRQDVERRQAETAEREKPKSERSGLDKIRAVTEGITLDQVRVLRDAVTEAGASSEELGLLLVTVGVENALVANLLTAESITKAEAKKAAALLTDEQANHVLVALEWEPSEGERDG